MGRPTSTVGIVSLFLFLAAMLVGAPLTLVCRQVTGTRTDRIEIGEEELGDGAVLTMRATNGTSVEAVRVLVRPAGLLSFLWSSTYWYSSIDGTFLRSESARGIAGVAPLTVIELVEDLRDR